MRAKFFNELNADRTTAAGILVREFNAGGEASRGEADTKHLTLTWSASNSTLRPGQRTVLLLSVKPKPGMHLYGAGDHSYVAIDWQISMAEGTELLDVEYPAPESKYLPAIKETVPVYREPMRIVRDFHMLGSREFSDALEGKNRIEFEGRFRYQACDAGRCYAPAEIPLTWVFDLEPHDLVRVPEEMRRDAGP